MDLDRVVSQAPNDLIGEALAEGAWHRHGLSTHRQVAAVAQLFINPNERQALPLRPPGNLVQLGTPGIDPRAGLNDAIIRELSGA